MTKLGSDTRLVTHTVKPKEEVAQAIERALAKQGEGASGLAEAEQILDALVREHPRDPRLRKLLGTVRAERAGSPKVTVASARRAFANLAKGARLLLAASVDTRRVHESAGAAPTSYDRRMMGVVNKLCEKPLADHNAPAATVLTVGEKVLAVGVNRAYVPLHDWRRHGEMEAMSALAERTYTGMGVVLKMFRDSGGALDADTSAMLDQLLAQGLEDPGFVDTPMTLRSGGFFAPDKIARYAHDLAAFVQEGGFRRDDDGDLHPHHRQLLQESLDEGLLQREDLADWASLDSLHASGTDDKMSLYTSLEPCGMCMQNCTSQGHVGRVVYGASDPQGGGVSTLEHYADLYYDLERVPFEILGGVEGKPVQERFDKWFKEVYPQLRAGSRPQVG